MRRVIIIGMAAILILSGCSIKNKQRSLSDEQRKQYSCYDIDRQLFDKYDVINISYEDIDVEKVLNKLINDELVEENIEKTVLDDCEVYSYQSDRGNYSWNISFDRKIFTFCTDIGGKENCGKDIDGVDAVDNLVREVVSQCGVECAISSDTREVLDENNYVLSYRFMINDIPLLGNRMIVADKHDDDSHPLTTSYIEVGVTDGIITMLTIQNIPRLSDVCSTMKEDNFISDDELLSIVDKNYIYPSSKYIEKISMMYIPVKDHVEHTFTPVFEVFFENDENEMTLSKTMLVDSVTGQCID